MLCTVAISFIHTPCKFPRSVQSDFYRKRLIIVKVSSLGLSFLLKIIGKAVERHRLSLYGLRVLSAIVEKLGEGFFSADQTEQHFNTPWAFLDQCRKTCNFCQFVDTPFHTCFISYAQFNDIVVTV